MNASQLKEFTHANTQQAVYVDMEMLFAHWFSTAQRCTIIQSTGGALLPIKEDADFVTEAKNAYLKEKENNGTASC